MPTVMIEDFEAVNPVPDPNGAVDPAVRNATLARVLASDGSSHAVAPARRWRSRLPLSAVLAPLVLTAAALAAGGILFGSAYSPPWAHRTPGADAGVPIAASVRLLPVRVADPAGGPAWGIRVLRTTRGYECVQVGRVVDGQLGVLGQDGWFGNDHRFHPMPTSAFADYDCGIVGAGGYALIGNWLTIHASGLFEVGRCAYPGWQGPVNRLPVCPAGDLRFIAYGLVGPGARAIAYAQGTMHHVSGTTGPEGAYLVVQRASGVITVHGSTAGGPGMAGRGGPGSFPGARAILYRDGLTCPAEDPPGTDACAYRSFMTGTGRIALTPVRVRVSRPHRDPSWPGVFQVVLRLRAPVAVHSAALDYAATAWNPARRFTTDNRLNRDVGQGATLAWPVEVPACTGHAVIKLYLVRATPHSQPGLGSIPVATLATLKIHLPHAARPAWCGSVLNKSSSR